MYVTEYTVVASIIWFSLFVVISYVLRLNHCFVSRYSPAPLIVVMLAGLARLFIPVELPFTRVIKSDTVMPFFQGLLNTPVVSTYTVLQLLITAWAAGALVKLSALLRQIYRAKRKVALLRTVQETPPFILPQMPDQLEVIFSSFVKTPQIIGIVHPVLIFPPIGFTDHEAALVLEHELQHYRGKDNLHKLLVDLACCLFWWNPLVYLLKHNLDYSLEVRSDLAVTGELDQGGKVSYLRSLIKVAKYQPERDEASKRYLLSAAISTGFFSADSEREIHSRFSTILMSGGRAKKRFTQVALYSVLFCLLALSFTFVVQPYGDTTEDGAFSISEENAYFVVTEEGHLLYVDGVEVCIIESIDEDPFNTLKVYGGE